MKSRPESGDFDAIPARLRGDVRRLGTLLGKVIASARGDAFVDKIERIRSLAKAARSDQDTDWTELTQELALLSDEELVDIARSFNQFLNLANLAEQKHSSEYQETAFLDDWNALYRLRGSNLRQDLANNHIELVLTAHPTEVLRRTLIKKYDAMVHALSLEDDVELERLISEAWHTDEIRRTKPTPIDEAEWGFNVLENSLWYAVPTLMRQIDQQLQAKGEQPLHPTCMPFRFASWMGGDRDGNPNVTAVTSQETIEVARKRAVTQFVQELDALIDSLSMHRCSEELARRTNHAVEPYRQVLRNLRADLETQIAAPLEDTTPTFRNEDLIEPLVACYESLQKTGLEMIARGPLLDTIRRACCFGVNWVNLDIRQHTERHEQVLEEWTRACNLKTSYTSWTESAKQSYLQQEIESSPLRVPEDWTPSKEVAETIATFEMIASLEGAGLGNYIISMATQPSDVLAVLFLLKAFGAKQPISVVPLCETLEDLNNAGDMLDTLLSFPTYRTYVRELDNRQQVMIGYSDSAKDAGQFAAAWAQYQAQESLMQVARSYGVKLTLFHGRGGAIGRGGGPTHEAILAQPPGTVAGNLRLTEQGEMIRFKLGSPDIAFETLSRYLFATVEATHTMRSADDVSLRKTVSDLADKTVSDYRQILADSDFVPLFNELTPETELAQLAIGSRPNRRQKAQRDISSLRAIPWVFAWTQVRLMLPAWLGTLRVLERVADDDKLRTRLLNWPFFRMQMELLEVMLAKVEPSLVNYYAMRLGISASERRLLSRILDLFQQSKDTMCQLRGSSELLAEQTLVSESLRVRNTYLDPLHLLQAELLSRFRSKTSSQETEVEKALKVTMSGIASGLRNTG